MPDLVYIGIGANLGDRNACIQSALDAISAPGVSLLRVSSLYETEPVGYLDQGLFLNAAAELSVSLEPRQLLDHLRAIEHALGRQRTIPNGPRTIDLDILLWSDLVLATPELTIPHPRMHERLFVLDPLAELAPSLLHPTLALTVSQLRDRLRAGPPV
jgi:2-amino-4-hydroxy-6-hydroxymethyldihydropteridine diphosphokinase